MEAVPRSAEEQTMDALSSQPISPVSGGATRRRMPTAQGDPMSTTTTTDVGELHQLIDGLRRCVTSLVSSYGDAPAMRRLVNDAERILNDVDRLDIDAEELEMTRGLTQPQPSAEKILIPDTDYDTDFWRDVDHEGVGGQSLAGAHVPRTRKRRFVI
jgi:hypothetical protein